MKSGSFEEFWSSYLRERDKYRDDAWDSHLQLRLRAYPHDVQENLVKIITDKFFDKSEIWGELTGVIRDRYSMEIERRILSTLRTEISPATNELDNYLGTMLVIAAMKNYPAVSDIVREVLLNYRINSMWRYLLRNIFLQDKDTFLKGIDRLIHENGKLGFDVRSYIRMHEDVHEFLCRESRHSAVIDLEIAEYG